MAKKTGDKKNSKKLGKKIANHKENCKKQVAVNRKKKGKTRI